MKKKIILMSALTAVFMLLLPILALELRTVVPFIVFVFLLYLICPICSIVVGAIAGTDIRRLWYFGFLPALIGFGAYAYIIGWDNALIFAGCYLMLGLIAMGIAALVKVFRQAKKDNRRR
ncbi:MAG: hypothetical protein J1E06_02605 [Acutalibacter sp.]|nr:hypothetical protein [Acutalibacter sp.]